MSRQTVSIRAPAWGAMATHSKIRPFRALAHPLITQNRRNLWSPFPLTLHCILPIREKTHRFYDHLELALEHSISSSHHFCVAVVNFRSPAPNDLLLVKFTSPNQATSSTLLDKQRPHQTLPLVYEQSIFYKECSTYSKTFLQKTKEKPTEDLIFSSIGLFL